MVLDGGAIDFAVNEPFLAYRDLSGTIYVAGPGGTEAVGTGTFTNYQVSAGRVAFERPAGPAGLSQVWLWTPDAGTEQLTFFGSDTRLEVLAANGQVTVLSNSHRLLFNPDGTFADLGGTLGRAFWLSGWYVIEGNALLQPISSDGGFYLPPACPALCVGGTCAIAVDGGATDGGSVTDGGRAIPRKAGCGCNAQPVEELLIGLAMIGFALRKRRGDLSQR
jgi:hypothetical protein